MRWLPSLVVALVLAGGGLYGCGHDDTGDPGHRSGGRFLHQIDHGCLGTVVPEAVYPPYDCYVVSHGWSADTLAIKIYFDADCCVSFVEDVSIDGMAVHITVTDTEIECDCVCPFENDFVFQWHQAGELALTFSDVSYTGTTICELDTTLVIEAD